MCCSDSGWSAGMKLSTLILILAIPSQALWRRPKIPSVQSYGQVWSSFKAVKLVSFVAARSGRRLLFSQKYPIL